MKQVLSVADFAVILNLVNDSISKMEYDAKFGRGFERPTKQEVAKRLKELGLNPYYQSLLHLKESLENLNVEVETPDIEIKGE